VSDESRLRLEIVTIERLVYADDVDEVLAPGAMGQLGILPKHAPLITSLETGELLARKEEREVAFAISGGFMEVLDDRVVVLADMAERADEIDIRRAEAARERAARLVHQRLGRIEAARAEAALRRSLTRLRVARHRAPRRMPRARETLGDE
jgi:F-type H+-transporting ATPase subunit epsilon